VTGFGKTRMNELSQYISKVILSLCKRAIKLMRTNYIAQRPTYSDGHDISTYNRF